MSKLPPIVQEVFTTAAIDRRTLWRWLEPEACRLAACYWWPTLPTEDIQSMMQLHAALVVQRPYAHGLSPEVRDKPGRSEIAKEVLREAIASMWAEHDASYQALVDATMDVLRSGGGKQEVLDTVLPIARRRTPMPPPWIVQEAIEKAAREFRFETKFWQRQRPRKRRA